MKSMRKLPQRTPSYKKVWDSIVTFRRDEYLWWQVAEYGYDSFMIRTRSQRLTRA